MIAAYPINFSIALAILVFFTYLVVRHFYKDRIEALNHMLNLYKERFGSIANGAQGSRQLQKPPNKPVIAKDASASADAVIKAQKAARVPEPTATLSESSPVPAGPYSRELRLHNAEGMEFHIDPSGDKYVCKLLNGPSPTINNVQLLLSSPRSFELSSRTWRDPILNFSGRVGPTTSPTNPGDFTQELDFATPQADRLRLGNHAASILKWPDGHPNPIRRWRIATTITWVELRQNQIQKGWDVEICLRWDTEQGILEFMEYADAIPPEGFL